MKRQLAGLLVLLALVAVGVKLTDRPALIDLIGPDCDAIYVRTMLIGDAKLMTDPIRIRRVREAMASIPTRWSAVIRFEGEATGGAGRTPRPYLDCNPRTEFLDCRSHGQKKIGFWLEILLGKDRDGLICCSKPGVPVLYTRVSRPDLERLFDALRPY